MGSGDLNTKKSWHVVNLKNQRRVWESEQAALAERKKVNERIEELRKERQEEEITRQLEAAGGTKRVDRVDWMYQGPSADNGGMVTEEAEAFLLGKRRIDSLLRGTEHKQLEKNAVPDRFATLGAGDGAANASSAVGAAGALPPAALARDMAAKIREDPLLAIKRQEQQSYAALANDPVRRRQMIKALGLESGDGDTSKNKSSSDNGRPSHRNGGENSNGNRNGNRNGTNGTNGNKNDAEERARKLAAMQSNAADLAKERQTRLAEIEAKESAAREADEKARAEDAKLTGGGMTTSFGTNLRKKAGDMDLSERLGRSRQGLQRDED
ncbi:MAG: RNA-splicing factor [Sporothrix thermara]